MAIVFDPKKNAHNIATRGISFEEVSAFDWHSAFIEMDLRRDYGEDRYIAVGLIGDRLHVLVFTPRGVDLRVISLRRANDREQATYAEKARPLSDG